MKKSNHPDDRILTQDHFWNLCLLYTELATYAQAFIPEVKEHIHPITMDVIISVYLANWDLHNESMRKEMYEMVLNNAKKYKVKIGLTPHKQTYITDIMKERQLPMDEMELVGNEECEVFKLIYIEGLDMYAIASILKLKCDHTAIVAIYNKCIAMFSALYITAKLILSGKAQQPVIE